MKLAVLLSFSGAGGVEKMVMNLVREFAKKPEIALDLILIRAQGPHLSNIPENVNVIKLKARHTLTAIPELVEYLKKTRPEAMLVAKDRAGRAAVIARGPAGVSTRICVRLGTNLSTALEHRSPLSAWLRTAPMRFIYPKVDKVIAVSEGVRADTLSITGVDENRVCVIRNPVVTPEFIQKRDEAGFPPHPWLSQKDCPVIMGAGRLSVQKDFGALLKAFGRVLKVRPVRLIIVGEGGKRRELEDLIRELGLEDSVLLPGFQADLYRWLKFANVFVLSSRWEGSPNVLTEALALGVPSVATRCPSGPDEILQNGLYGPLVPVGDDELMATGILSVLERPHPSEFLMRAVKEYRSDVSAERYWGVLFGDNP